MKSLDYFLRRGSYFQLEKKKVVFSKTEEKHNERAIMLGIVLGVPKNGKK